MVTERAPEPKTFYLNERQELANLTHDGGRAPSPLVGVDWTAHASTLETSFARATSKPAGTRDPAAATHHFVLAVPVRAVAKVSTSKAAKGQGYLTEVPTFGGEQSKLFKRLGLDLIEVLADGQASVHVAASQVVPLLATLKRLPTANLREQARWGPLAEFRATAWTTRVDVAWLQSLKTNTPTETFVRFQPTLLRTEVEDVLRALTLVVNGPYTRLTQAGREFSGRYWCAGVFTRAQIEAIAKEFLSVQSLHPPAPIPLAASKRQKKSQNQGSPLPGISPLPAAAVANMPTVAIVDTGIPEAHPLLAPFRRSGYRNPNLDPFVQHIGDHGSTVASCAVFGGALDPSQAPQNPVGSCRVLDVNVGVDHNLVDGELVVQAVQTIVATAPDVRVFNLSFGGAPLDALDPVARREALIKLQDLDNLAFASDLLLVIAAGNSPRGLVPTAAYPGHVDDPRWALGATARSFNGAVCGAYVAVLGDDTVAGIQGAPSPFTRIGPGLCDSPVPGFSAPGGNALANYAWAPGTGVMVCAADGSWEDHAGTSVAAPLVAREAAWTFHELARRCGTATLPFAGTVKAWMHLVATRVQLTGAYEKLAVRTLGRGLPNVERLQRPLPTSAVFVWQTVLQTPKSIARVQLPVPLPWLNQAKSPRIRVVASWNTPVNYALVESWACRKVSFRLRPFGLVAALHGKRGPASGGYPILDRTFDIEPSVLTGKKFEPSDDPWILEVEYEEIGEYPPAMTISPQQRVGLVIELWDDAPEPTSPQPFVQLSAFAIELDRLSVLQEPLQAAVVIRT